MTDGLQVELTVSSRALSVAQLDAFEVGFVVTNRGKVPIDPKLDRSELHVNGMFSPYWATAASNGSRAPEWNALPPGGQIQRQFRLGRFLLPRPGEYQLVLSMAEHRTPPLTVRVSP